MLTGTMNKPNECPRCGQFSANQDICEYCGSPLNVAEQPRHDTPQPDVPQQASQQPQQPEEQHSNSGSPTPSGMRHHYGIHDGIKVGTVPEPPQKKPSYAIMFIVIAAMAGCWYYFNREDRP